MRQGLTFGHSTNIMQSSNLITDKSSSLAIHRNDADVFRIVQTEGGMKYASSMRYDYADFGFEKRDTSAYDSPFERKAKPETFNLADNLRAVSRMTTLHNFSKRRAYQEKQLERAKRDYENSLKAANLCHVCLFPIKTVSHQIVEIFTTRRQREIMRAASGRSFEAAALELIRYEMDVDAAAQWKELTSKRKWKSMFRHVRVTTITVGEIRSHYQSFKFTDKGGNTKLYYGLVDGTKRGGKLLPMKVTIGKFGQSEYYTIPDLIKLDGEPSESYRVRDLKCECKHGELN